jgi:hypothetical protein
MGAPFVSRDSDKAKQRLVPVAKYHGNGGHDSQLVHRLIEEGVMESGLSFNHENSCSLFREEYDSRARVCDCRVRWASSSGKLYEF